MSFFPTLKKWVYPPSRLNRISFLKRSISWFVMTAIVPIFFAIAIPSFQSYTGTTLPECPAIIWVPLLIICLIYFGICTVGSIYCYVSRLHDLNKSGWLLVVLFFAGYIFRSILFIAWITLLVYPGTRGTNAYGNP